MTKRVGFAVLALAVAALLGTGCTSQAYQQAIFAKAKTLQAAPDYRIGAGDSIQIRLLGTTQMADNSFAGTVRPDGKISFPGYGEVMVEGKTTGELRSELAEEFKQAPLGIKRPRVYVNVTAFQSKSVTILGQVQRPGRVPYTGQTRIADLLGTALGTDAIRAAGNRTLLFREVDGAVKVYHVRLNDFFRKANFETNFYVRPGDVLYVPRNGYSSVELGIRKVMLPIEAIFRAVGIGNQTTAVFVP